MRSAIVPLWKTWLLPLLTAVALLVSLSSTAFAQSTTFQSIPPVAIGTLNAVSTSSTTDTWAVGLQFKNANTIIDTLAQHWNGHAWTVVSTPSPHNNVDILSAVADLSPTNAWAVGNGSGSNGFSDALIEHFNGTNWRVVAPPADNGNLEDSLSAISALSANDIWAAGSHFDATIGGTDGLFEHWNGTAWSIVPSPSTFTQNGVEFAVGAITSLTAISSNDVWAATTVGNNNPVAFEHWNGTQWSLIFAPGVTNSSANIASLAASSSNDVWAVGTSRASGRRKPTLTLIEHWDGNAWSIVPSPALSTPSGFLSGVTALSRTDAWAVGGTFTGIPVVEHWDGNQWSLVSVPISTGANANNQLSAISSLSSGTVIAVGNEVAILNTNG
ncbi:MAG: hypothetical protein JO011_21645 [Ktedonobacteraceae bacterium]|nr:hypothetical protein [Ktedonobacteraceae bacterium]